VSYAIWLLTKIEKNIPDVAERFTTRYSKTQILMKKVGNIALDGLLVTIVLIVLAVRIGVYIWID